MEHAYTDLTRNPDILLSIGATCADSTQERVRALLEPQSSLRERAGLLRDLLWDVESALWSAHTQQRREFALRTTALISVAAHLLVEQADRDAAASEVIQSLLHAREIFARIGAEYPRRAFAVWFLVDQRPESWRAANWQRNVISARSADALRALLD